jgi:hypothetical protein
MSIRRRDAGRRGNRCCARGMGEWDAWVEKQIPPLRYGMTNKKQRQEQRQK